MQGHEVVETVGIGGDGRECVFEGALFLVHCGGNINRLLVSIHDIS